MHSLRILRVLASLETAVGGPAESAANSCIAAQRAGIHNTLAFLLPERSIASTEGVRERLASEGVLLRPFKSWPDPSYYALRWAVSPSLAAWLVRCSGHYDLIHIHGAWGFSQMAALLAGQKCNRPCVMTPHEALTTFDMEERGANRFRPAAKKAMKWIYLGRLSLIVFSSPLEAKDSLLEGTMSKTAVIAHPLRDAFEVPNSNGRRRGGEPLRIGFLGRLDKKKNLEVLIRAIQTGTRQARLIVAGDGPQGYRRQLEELSRTTGVADRVEWVGFVEGMRKWEFIDDLDLLAMPSRYECFGMAAAEALARGTPAVVSEMTGIADLIKRRGCGVVIPPTVDSFAEVLGELESDRPKLSNLAASGPPAAHEELSLSAYGRTIRQEYEALLDWK